MPLRSFSMAPASPKPLMQTSAPSCAKARAIASPMPEVEPVTRAVLPLNDMTFLQQRDGQSMAQPRLSRRRDKAARVIFNDFGYDSIMDTTPLHPPHPSGHRFAPVARPENCG